MSTTTEHVDSEHGGGPAHAHDAHGAAHAEHKSDGYYVVVALVLAAITALETSTYWVDFGPIFMPLLLALMTIKFVMVVSLFMHLKFDNKIFSYMFYSGLLLALGVYLSALATFRFFGSG
jgi:cytochrome c oxidase subunit 4